MDTSEQRQRPDKDLAKDSAKKYDTVSIFYTNSSFQCFGRPIQIPKAYENWADLRYALESCFGTVSNHSTYLRGFTIEKQELYDKDLLPESILVKRCVMPFGLRQYIPPEANVKYMKAKEDLKAVLLGIAEEEQAFQAFVQSIDYTNYKDATFERNPKLLKQKETLEAYIKSVEEKSGKHASTFQEVLLDISTEHAKQMTSYVRPWSTYVCQGCLKQGHHFKDACFLFPEERIQKDLSFKWGAHKMKKL